MDTLFYVLAGLAGVTLLAWLALALWLLWGLRAVNLQEASDDHE